MSSPLPQPESPRAAQVMATTGPGARISEGSIPPPTLGLAGFREKKTDWVGGGGGWGGAGGGEDAHHVAGGVGRAVVQVEGHEFAGLVALDLSGQAGEDAAAEGV